MRTTTVIGAIFGLSCLQAVNASETLQGPTNAIGPFAGPPQPEVPAVVESDAAGIGITLDEHILTDPRRDQDFNGAGEVTLSGASATHAGLFLVPSLDLIDRAWGFSSPASSSQYHSGDAFAAGLMIFTPSDLTRSYPLPGDRPYASEFFMSYGKRYVSLASPVVYDSSLTFGILGLPWAASVQKGLHDITGSTQPEGWSHQISDGGEATASYSLARQSLLLQRSNLDAKWTVAGDLGTVTEASVALDMRYGRIASPWWAFTPAENTYVQQPTPAAPPIARDAGPEIFAMFGARLKVRAYNAFLQGQFRNSDDRLSSDQVNHVFGEAWAGMEFRTTRGWEFRYLARWESPEIRSGIGSRSITWGSFEIAKSFGAP
jgi:hypothetical protein